MEDIKIQRLKVGDRVQSLVTGSYGSVTGFRYFSNSPMSLMATDPYPHWVHEGGGVSQDSEDSFDVLWDDGQESLGCFPNSKIKLLTGKELSEAHKALLAQNEQLKKQLAYGDRVCAYYQRLALAATKVPQITRREWEMQQDYLPYEESPYGDS